MTMVYLLSKKSRAEQNYEVSSIRLAKEDIHFCS